MKGDKIMEDYKGLYDAANNLVKWLNSKGRTSKDRRGRVPSRLLEALENAIVKAEEGENNEGD